MFSCQAINSVKALKGTKPVDCPHFYHKTQLY